MNTAQVEVFQNQRVKIKNLLPEIGVEKMRAELIDGLLSDEKYISSKYFYNAVGSQLFEEITRLPEYYPTRTEKSILKKIAPELMNEHPRMEIIELGSGDCSKISILFKAVDKPVLEHLNYIPLDVSESAIQQSASNLSEIYPLLKIRGYVADFTHQLDEIPRSDDPRLICFLGSTIGNFSTEDTGKILKNIACSILPGDSLLIGFDLVKSAEILNAAYNDAAGVTLKFNKNILNSVNDILQSDFDEDNFKHVAFYNSAKLRVEMHLEAKKDLEVNSPFFDAPLPIKKGQTIHTENSNKFVPEDFELIAKKAGLKIKQIYTDPKNWFALVRFEKV